MNSLVAKLFARGDDGDDGDSSSSESGTCTPCNDRIALIVVCIVLGITNITTFTLLFRVTLRRRRSSGTKDEQDPYERYDSRSRRHWWRRPWRRSELSQRRAQELSRKDPANEWERALSRTSGEEDVHAEMQRRDIIRKSLQSRTSITNISGNNSPTSPEPKSAQLPSSPPQHQAVIQTRRRAGTGATTINSIPEAEGTGQADSQPEAGEDERLQAQARARVDQMWQLLNKRGIRSPTRIAARDDSVITSQPQSPPPHQQLRHSSEAASASQQEIDMPSPTISRWPTVRLRTPPLLSHPALRSGGISANGGWNGGRRPLPKHASFPTELLSIRPPPPANNP